MNGDYLARAALWLLGGLADRYDPLNPAMLSFLHWVVQQCHAAGTPITMCGEMGSRPLEAMGLIGIGLTSISMVPSAIGSVKAMVMSLDQKKLWGFMEPLLKSSLHTIRPDLMEFAQRNGVVL